jgi:CheY-like chemotaxis protein
MMVMKLSILVVDDDRDNADSLVELFEMEGHRVPLPVSASKQLPLKSTPPSTLPSWMS